MAGSAPTNNSAVQFEQQQAAEADQKEAQRQADLQSGISAINAIYDPQPVMDTTTQNYDWSTFKPPSTSAAAVAAQYQQMGSGGSGGGAAPAVDPGSVPAGYTAVQVAPKAAAPGTPGAAAPSRYSGGATGSAAAAPTGYASRYSGGAATPSGGGNSPVWALQDASGKTYYQGDPLTYTTQTPDPSGKTTGGFGDDYYNAYNQKILDYYEPDEQRQYDEAQRDLQYSLARAGTLQSSTAADKQGDLAYQDATNKAQIVSNANDQTGQLRDSINADKQSLINQLYTTDDPTLTANLAQSSAQASQLKDPTLTPMAGLFNTALTTVGSAVSPLTSPYSVVQPGATGAVSSPVPASASANSGKYTAN